MTDTVLHSWSSDKIMYRWFHICSYSRWESIYIYNDRIEISDEGIMCDKEHWHIYGEKHTPYKMVLALLNII